MFESAKTWFNKKPGPLLILLISISLTLSCSSATSINSSTYFSGKSQAQNDVNDYVFYKEDVFKSVFDNEGDLLKLKVKPEIDSKMTFLANENSSYLFNRYYSFHSVSKDYIPPEKILSYDVGDDNAELLKFVAKNLTSKPEKNGFSFSDILGFLGAVGAFLNFCYVRYSEISKSRQSYRDEFWLRQVLFPSFISHVQGLVANARETLTCCEGDATKLSIALRAPFNSIRDESVLFNTYSVSFQDRINSAIDDIDERIGDISEESDNKITNADYMLLLQDFTKKVFSLLDEIHATQNEAVTFFSVETLSQIFFIRKSKKIASIHDADSGGEQR